VRVQGAVTEDAVKGKPRLQRRTASIAHFPDAGEDDFIFDLDWLFHGPFRSQQTRKVRRFRGLKQSRRAWVAASWCLL